VAVDRFDRAILLSFGQGARTTAWPSSAKVMELPETRPIPAKCNVSQAEPIENRTMDESKDEPESEPMRDADTR
jgi:hypothetical protein